MLRGLCALNGEKKNINFLTSLTGHEIFGLVFAEVEAAGQNHIIVVALRKKHRQEFSEVEILNRLIYTV